MSSQIVLIHALSPLHAGIGQSTGPVDLGIARDRSTGFPYLPGSSIKGSLRDRASHTAPDAVTEIFGPPTENASDHAGGVVFGDANLLLLPVRSVAGTFAWLTSPYLLARFARDAKESGIALPALPALEGKDRIATTANSSIALNGRVYCEDLDFTCTKQPAALADALATTLAGLLFPNAEDQEWRDGFVSRFGIVHDDAMAFLSRHGTDVVTRVAIDSDRKTVKQGQLWTEENLPSETILAGLVTATPNRKTRDAAGLLAALRPITRGTVQFGGNNTVGRGRCRVVFAGGAR